MEQLQGQLSALAEGIEPEVEQHHVEVMPLLVGADGVMVAFRGEAKPTRWREIKVGIVARLGHRANGDSYLVHRRLVAHRGPIEDFAPRLWLESLRQGIKQARSVAWFSDGDRGYWGVYADRFAGYATGILDFYHAAQNLWKGTRSWLDGRTRSAKDWFSKTRRALRKGHREAVFAELELALAVVGLPKRAHKSLTKVYQYLKRHEAHIDYARFEDLGLPLGSGMVESACKWLLQQRFKGVGMRWSEDGFDHLLHLRLAWVNGRFERLFNPSPI